MVIKDDQVDAAPEEVEEEATISKEIDKLLDEGWSLGRLVKAGYARSTIRMRMRKRAKTNPPPPDNGGKGNNHEVSLTIKEKEQVLPEWLESQVGELYDSDEKTRKIFMAGMSIPLLGMRLFAESFKPLLALMQTYQAGQAEAAKAAQGGAGEVAEETVARAIPYFTDAMKDIARSSSPAPMQAMMARMMEQAMSPMIQNMMGGMFKQPSQSQGQQGQGQSLPPGWTASEGQK